MKRNCENCTNLEWAFGDTNDPEGYICIRKDFPLGREEDEMFKKMDRDSYRKKSKVCFKGKTERNENVGARMDKPKVLYFNKYTTELHLGPLNEDDLCMIDKSAYDAITEELKETNRRLKIAKSNSDAFLESARVFENNVRDLLKDRDHWKQKAMELEADLKTIRNYESSTLGLANKEIENLRAENQELKEALEKIRRKQ